MTSEVLSISVSKRVTNSVQSYTARINGTGSTLGAAYLEISIPLNLRCGRARSLSHGRVAKLTRLYTTISMTEVEKHNRWATAKVVLCQRVVQLPS